MICVAFSSIEGLNLLISSQSIAENAAIIIKYTNSIVTSPFSKIANIISNYFKYNATDILL